MTKRIFRSILIVALAILLACFALFLSVLYDYFSTVEKNQLKAQLDFAAKGTDAGGLDYLSSLEIKDSRLTWIDAAGTVLFDSMSESAEMENHAQREEFIKALQTGSGESSRYSITRTEQTLYFATRLNDGTVLRISVSRRTMISLVLSMLQPISMVLLAALILSGVLASRLSKKIVQPLERINYEHPMQSNVYPELTPILKQMEQQRNQILRQETRLAERKKEFLAITGKMSEGLLLLNEKNEILSVNPAAESFFSLRDDCTGKDFFSLSISDEISGTLKAARENGYSETQLPQGGREYLVRASHVENGGGIVILVFDVTDRVFAERNRREFTANVSHELKTPLQAIIGSAELLQNDLVKPEDTKAFIGRIRTEAERLVSLIEDIIRLSRLDEKGELPFEEIELLELVTNEVSSLRKLADDRHIDLTVEGSETYLSGVRQLLHEIVSNLCDNAIKYNVDGGSVLICVGESGQSAVLRVKDSGIGISKEHQERIFERFYRVDKSHSRQIGGTGLGLSIVKHAAEYMKGTIRIESNPGAGTTISVFFPKNA